MDDMANTTERIADKVRGIAAEKRSSQQNTADILGISRTSVVERMNGRIPFTATEILLLATAWQVPVSRFFPREIAIVEAAA